MPREKPYFRETMNRLDEKFPDKEVLSQKELATFLGVTTRFLQDRWKPYYNKLLHGYSKTKIASILAD